MIENKVIATITARNQEDDDLAVVIVRLAGDKVVLGTSLQKNGDLQVCLESEQAVAIASALQQAADELRTK